MKSADIIRLLPGVMQRTAHSDSALLTLAAIMEQLHAPTEAMLGELEQVFDPRQTDRAHLPMLAHWLNLDRLFHADSATATASLWQDRPLPTEAGHMREMIAVAVTISRWRGTHQGRLMLLRTATGLSNFEINDSVCDAQGDIMPFHVQVTYPAEAQSYRELIVRIVEQEKPAYITADIVLGAAPREARPSPI